MCRDSGESGRLGASCKFTELLLDWSGEAHQAKSQTHLHLRVRELYAWVIQWAFLEHMISVLHFRVVFHRACLRSHI